MKFHDNNETLNELGYRYK